MTRLGALLVAIGLASCATSSRIEQEPPAPLAEFAPQAQVRELWRANVGDLAGDYEARLVPTLFGDALFVANAEGGVYALAVDDGRTLWRTDLALEITGGAGVGEGLLAVGTRKGEVIALDAASGAHRWVGQVSSEVLAPPAIRNGFVVVQSIDGKLTGLNAQDGKRLWVFDRSEPALSLQGTGAPLIVGDFVLSGFANGKIVALALKDGKMLWEHTVAQARGRNEVERLVDVDAPLLLWGETLYAVAFQGQLIAVNMRSGRVAWTREVSSYVKMDADRGAVYVADDRGNVLAFDHASGASLWRQDKLRGRGLSGAALQEDAVVVGDAEGYLHWMARDDGRLLARYQLDSTAVQVGGLTNGSTLYVASRDGRVAALQLTRSN